MIAYATFLLGDSNEAWTNDETLHDQNFAFISPTVPNSLLPR